METFGHAITLLLIILIILIPVYLFRKEYGFIKSMAFALPICVLLFIVISWWVDIWPDIRLGLMGYDLYGMSESERLANVPQELKEDATRIYLSRFGVGWPVKAIFGIVFYVIPYLLISLGGAAVWRKYYKNKFNKS